MQRRDVRLFVGDRRNSSARRVLLESRIGNGLFRGRLNRTIEDAKGVGNVDLSSRTSIFCFFGASLRFFENLERSLFLRVHIDGRDVFGDARFGKRAFVRLDARRFVRYADGRRDKDGTDRSIRRAGA